MAKLYRPWARARASCLAFGAASFLLLGLLLSSCQARRPSAGPPGTSLPPSPPGPGAPPGSRPPAPPPPIKMSPGTPAQDGSGTPRALGRAMVLTPELAAERAYGLAASPGTILPSDSRLGPLEDLRAQDGARAAVLLPAQAFLDGLLKGRLPKEEILPSRLDLVTLMAGPVLGDARPREWRLGRLQVDAKAGSASALAAFSLAWPGREGEKPAWSKGELGLREAAGTWLVESLSLEAPPPASGQGD